MAAGQPSSRNPFERMSDDTLGIIAGSLSAKDRVCFLSCCRATRRYQLSSPGSLFSELGLKLARPWVVENWVVWLARVKQQVGKLSLTWDSGDEDMSAMSMLLLGALADSSLHTLGIMVTGAGGRVRLGGWLSILRCLRGVHITADQVQLGDRLSSLTALTMLNLYSQGVHLTIPPESLPPALEMLKLERFDAASLGEALLTAGPLRQLKRLVLVNPTEPWQSEAHWDALAAHTKLTTLALDGWQLREVPRQLGALTCLRELALSKTLLGGNEASLEALTSLTQLSKIHLPNAGLGLVPASVLALPALKHLDLMGNPFVGPILTARSPNLTRLAIEASSAVEACEGLTALSVLRTLVLSAPPTEDRVKHDDAAKLIHSLSKLPNFAELDARLVGCNPNPFSVARDVLLAWTVLPFTILTSSGGGQQ